MPQFRTILGTSAAVIGSCLIFRAVWPFMDASPTEAVPSFTMDKNWGILNSLIKTHQTGAALFRATEHFGYHRIRQTLQIESGGRYRLSVETQYIEGGSTGLEIEVGDPDQPKYSRVLLNLRDGNISRSDGDPVLAGVDILDDKPGHFRWWVEMPLVSGRAGYDLSLLAANEIVQFRGNPACTVMFIRQPTFVKVQ